MKKFSKIMSLVLVAVMVLSLGALSTSAALPPLDYERGDVNLDGGVDIKDASLIQKYHVGSEELTKVQIAVSDFDMDEEYTVKDATLIQKVLAGLVEYDFLNNGAVWQDIWFQGLYANYDSGKAQVGVPVTFYANAYANPVPMTLEFKVNGEVIYERGEDTAWEYTFTEAGNYTIEVTLYSLLDRARTKTMNYTVVEPYETGELMFTGIALDAVHPDDMRKMTAYAFVKGGTAPYEYSFVVSAYDEFRGNYTLMSRDFSQDNSYTIGDRDNRIDIGEYTLTVTAVDSTGETITQDYALVVGGALIG